MIVIRHQTICYQSNVISIPVLCEDREKAAIVIRRLEERKLVSTSIVDVVDMIVEIFGHDCLAP
jgi:hypothetical protein